MKKYHIKFKVSETTLPKVDALWAALKAAEDEEIEMVEFDPSKLRAAKAAEIGGNADV
ncbi:hypothetical protein [Bradyrhizobium sp.]|uniref:hypothetical protein n=1 Tax=Bradyrhizobium sp. TaxID=376 RepID=UPI0025BF7D84|nr:hypothetical protein [Bradyrhizobium sp.]